MKNADTIRSTNKVTSVTVNAVSQKESAELESKTIEEKRLKLALGLRRF